MYWKAIDIMYTTIIQHTKQNWQASTLSKFGRHCEDHSAKIKLRI